jgi:hypothetical protein
VELFHLAVDAMAILPDGFDDGWHLFGTVRRHGVRLSTASRAPEMQDRLLEIPLPPQLASNYEIRSGDARRPEFVVPAGIFASVRASADTYTRRGGRRDVQAALGAWPR